MGRMAKSLRRAALFVALILLAAALAAIAGAVVPRPLFGGGQADTDAPPTRRVMVLANPIHTDIAVAVDADLLARFGFLRAAGLPIDDAGVGWLVFGWGGRAFYLETPTWADLKPGPLARALTLDRSVMHVALAGAIDEGHESVLAIDLSETRHALLLDHLEASFAYDGAGAPILIAGRSYGEYDRFYEANGHFNALVGCNVWTASALRAAGVRTGWWNPLPDSLFWSIETHNALARQPSLDISRSRSQP